LTVEFNINFNTEKFLSSLSNVTYEIEFNMKFNSAGIYREHVSVVTKGRNHECTQRVCVPRGGGETLERFPADAVSACQRRPTPATHPIDQADCSMGLANGAGMAFR